MIRVPTGTVDKVFSVLTHQKFDLVSLIVEAAHTVQYRSKMLYLINCVNAVRKQCDMATSLISLLYIKCNECRSAHPPIFTHH